MRDYSIEERYFESFSRLGLGDIFEDTKERDIVKYRQLFQTILRKAERFSDTRIANYCTYKGKKTHRTTIVHSVKKTMTENYYQDADVAEVYDLFLDDKKKARKRKLEREDNDRVRRLMLAERDRKNILWDLVKDVPKDKQQELYDLVSLRIKSWEWKSNTSGKVYECGYSTFS